MMDREYRWNARRALAAQIAIAAILWALAIVIVWRFV